MANERIARRVAPDGMTRLTLRGMPGTRYRINEVIHEDGREILATFETGSFYDSPGGFEFVYELTNDVHYLVEMLPSTATSFEDSFTHDFVADGTPVWFDQKDEVVALNDALAEVVDTDRRPLAIVFLPMSIETSSRLSAVFERDSTVRSIVADFPLDSEPLGMKIRSDAWIVEAPPRDPS